MERFDSLRLKYKTVTREAFVAKNPPLWLIRELAAEEEEAAKFATVAMIPQAADLVRKPIAPVTASAMIARLRSAPNRFYIYPIAKRATGMWQGRVLVGRALNADIVLRHPSVSKLHAYFEKDASEQVTLCDARSANGTTVEGKLIPKDLPLMVAPDMVIVFGSVRCAIIAAGRLFDCM